MSEDLHHWEELSTALTASTEDEWDNLALWSGSIIEKDGISHLFYTGRTKMVNKYNEQKIGGVTSEDLISWIKHTKNPVLEANQRYYQTFFEKGALDKIGAWRDPYVFWDPISNCYYMTSTVRSNGDSKKFNGCVGLARGSDLYSWKTLPPIQIPCRFDEAETTQMIIHEDAYYLFYTKLRSSTI